MSHCAIAFPRKPVGRMATAGQSAGARSGRHARGASIPSLVVKRLWGFDKVRHGGLAKNTARAFALFALANLYLVRYRLLSAGATCHRSGAGSWVGEILLTLR